MKLCPGCKRYYADDTQVFCLEDGIQLDLVADSNATFQMPAARETDPPATLILPPDLPSDQTRLAGQVPPTVPAGTAPAANYAPSAVPVPPGGQMHLPVSASAVPPKKNTALIAAVVVLAAVVLGLGGVLGYMYLRSENKTGGTNGGSNLPGGSNSNTAGKTNTGGSDNSNTGGGTTGNANTGTDDNGGGGGTGGDVTWLQGSWAGSGTQYDGGKWTLTYVNANGAHTVEYPSIRCGGRWEPVSIKSNEAVFNEVITHGKDCINGRVVVTPTSDGALDCKWYYVGDIVGASATLRRQ